MAAFKKGALSGRRGLGSIFVWASGNGGRYQDHCNCDGYTNSIYTISISSTSEKEEIPWYSEQCASTLASTYSSGSSSEKQIVTTDLRHICTEKYVLKVSPSTSSSLYKNLHILVVLEVL